MLKNDRMVPQVPMPATSANAFSFANKCGAVLETAMHMQVIAMAATCATMCDSEATRATSGNEPNRTVVKNAESIQAQ